MLSTRELIRALRAANPEADVTEDLIRSAIRRELVEPPSTFAGRYAWSWDEARLVADALGLVLPNQPSEVMGR